MIVHGQLTIPKTTAIQDELILLHTLFYMYHVVTITKSFFSMMPCAKWRRKNCLKKDELSSESKGAKDDSCSPSPSVFAIFVIFELIILKQDVK